MSGVGGVRTGYLDAARTARLRRTGRPAHDVVLFAELLRACGARVPGGAPVRATQALGLVALDRPADVQDALRCTLTVDRPGQGLFDLVFPVFWSAADVRTAATDADPDPAPDAPGTAGGGSRPGAAPGEAGRGSPGLRAAQPTHGREAGTSAPVAELAGREIDELARRFVVAVGHTPGRRRRPAATGDLVDLRSSMRRNLGSGTELLVLLRSRPTPRRARLVVLCDVSSSMAPVTALFLRFTHALARHARLVEVGVFNVELTVVGEQFRRRSSAAALAWLHRQEHALAGGTRIGHCLHRFLDLVEDHGGLTRDTVAIVLSDGWDVGEPALLGEQMRRLHRQVGRVIWCDPHAAAAGFRPEVRGLLAALPFVDDHLDLSGTPALRALVEHVERTVPTRTRTWRTPA